MKNVSIILLLLFSCVTFSECKKYPEDDVWIQCKRPEKRLIKYGPWKFEKLTVDGVDKSSEFRADSAYFDRIEFEEQDEFSTDITVDRMIGSEIGSYSFEENRSKIRFTMIPGPFNVDFHNYGPIFKTTAIDWEILKLSKKGVVLKTNYISSEYVLELKPVN